MTPVPNKPVPEIDPHLVENQNALPAEFWTPYFGKHVAFSMDGRSVLVAGDSYEDVFDLLEQAGIDSSGVVLGYVDDGTRMNGLTPVVD